MATPTPLTVAIELPGRGTMLCRNAAHTHAHALIAVEAHLTYGEHRMLHVGEDAAARDRARGHLLQRSQTRFLQAFGLVDQHPHISCDIVASYRPLFPGIYPGIESCNRGFRSRNEAPKGTQACFVCTSHNTTALNLHYLMREIRDLIVDTQHRRRTGVAWSSRR